MRSRVAKILPYYGWTLYVPMSYKIHEKGKNGYTVDVPRGKWL